MQNNGTNSSSSNNNSATGSYYHNGGGSSFSQLLLASTTLGLTSEGLSSGGDWMEPSTSSQSPIPSSVIYPHPFSSSSDGSQSQSSSGSGDLSSSPAARVLCSFMCSGEQEKSSPAYDVLYGNANDWPSQENDPLPNMNANWMNSNRRRVSLNLNRWPIVLDHGTTQHVSDIAPAVLNPGECIVSEADLARLVMYANDKPNRLPLSSATWRAFGSNQPDERESIVTAATMEQPRCCYKVPRTAARKEEVPVVPVARKRHLSGRHSNHTATISMTDVNPALANLSSSKKHSSRRKERERGRKKHSRRAVTTGEDADTDKENIEPNLATKAKKKKKTTSRRGGSNNSSSKRDKATRQHVRTRTTEASPNVLSFEGTPKVPCTPRSDLVSPPCDSSSSSSSHLPALDADVAVDASSVSSSYAVADATMENGKKPHDFYSPLYTRGELEQREGRCEYCSPPRWYNMKKSIYWYHLQFVHGISAITRQPFRPPSATSDCEGNDKLVLCGDCKKWVPKGNRSNSLWYRHAYKCQKMWQ